MLLGPIPFEHAGENLSAYVNANEDGDPNSGPPRPDLAHDKRVEYVAASTSREKTTYIFYICPEDVQVVVIEDHGPVARCLTDANMRKILAAVAKIYGRADGAQRVGLSGGRDGARIGGMAAKDAVLMSELTRAQALPIVLRAGFRLDRGGAAAE